MSQLYAYYSLTQEQNTKITFNYQDINHPSKCILCTEVSEEPPEKFIMNSMFKDTVYKGKVNTIINYTDLTSYLL